MLANGRWDLIRRLKVNLLTGIDKINEKLQSVFGPG